MKSLSKIVTFTATALVSLRVGAIPIQNPSFETGDLAGWEGAGDVSTQTAALGIEPTDGRFAALITTLGNPSKPNSYSGEDALGALSLLQWLGMDTTFNEMLRMSSEAPEVHVSEIGAHAGLRTSFSMRAGDVVTFDWNHVGDWADGAFALFYETGNDFWSGDYMNLQMGGHLTQMDLGVPDPFGCGATSVCDSESGWQTSSFVASRSGHFNLVFGVYDRMDPAYASALWVDRVSMLPVPEPSTLALFCVGVGLIARRWRSTSLRFSNPEQRID